MQLSTARPHNCHGLLLSSPIIPTRSEQRSTPLTILNKQYTGSSLRASNQHKIMKITKTLLLLLFCAFIGIVYADNGGEPSSIVRNDISMNNTERNTKKSSNHLRKMVRIETIINILDNFRRNRYLRKLSDNSGNFQLFTKSGKAASTKSDKATKSSKALGSKAKGQKEVEEDTSSLFSTCSDVQAKLDTCEATATAPHWLFVQIADMCTLYRDDDGVFYLESNKFHEDTEWFTDRPMQLEKTEPTAEWFANFNELFDDEKGMPNAALTIVDDDTSKDVVVSVFAEAYVKEGGSEGEVTYGYELKQSTEQESVLSLEDLMEGKESVTFDHCSMFVDEFPTANI